MFYSDEAIKILISPSVTVTSNVYVASFPVGSTNLYVTGVVPIVKNCPGECVLLAKVTVPELSVADGSSHCTVVPRPGVLHSISTFLPAPVDGGVITGGTSSTTLKRFKPHSNYNNNEITK